MPFLKEMLYEAVFWRTGYNKPSFEEAFALPEVSKSLADWGKRKGDTAVVATIHANPVGAAWYRYWTDENIINGYIDAATPVLVIGVHRVYRHQGIGGKLIARLLEYASEQAIQSVSLSVSKDNYAINLYRQHGFREVADNGNACLMLREM